MSLRKLRGLVDVIFLDWNLTTLLGGLSNCKSGMENNIKGHGSKYQKRWNAL